MNRKDYAKKRRQKIDIQVNRLRFQINKIQFEKISKILRLGELGICSCPYLTFTAFNLGEKKFQERKKADSAEVAKTMESQKVKFNLYWAVYPRAGRKDYSAALATFSMIDEIPDLATFYGVIKQCVKKWVKDGRCKPMNDFLKEAPWKSMPPVFSLILKEEKHEYEAIVEANVRKYMEENAA